MARRDVCKGCGKYRPIRGTNEMVGRTVGAECRATKNELLFCARRAMSERDGLARRVAKQEGLIVGWVFQCKLTPATCPVCPHRKFCDKVKAVFARIAKRNQSAKPEKEKR